MGIGSGIFGIVLSVAFLFIALLIFDAFETNVITCGNLNNSTSVVACNTIITYAGIAFTIAPIAILLDVVGLLPIFGGRFSFS